MSRWDCFNDDEIYILKRQAIESSYEIVMSGNYDKAWASTHTELMNELSIEWKKRFRKTD
jgi:hypothetical protein